MSSTWEAAGTLWKTELQPDGSRLESNLSPMLHLSLSGSPETLDISGLTCALRTITISQLSVWIEENQALQYVTLMPVVN